MRFITYLSNSGPRLAVFTDGTYIDVNQADSSLPSCLKELCAHGPELLEKVAHAITIGVPLDSNEIKILAPIPDPQKIICVGLNYADHAAESGATVGDEPVIFNKFPTALRAHEDQIELPPVSDEVDYEAELVVVIGKGGKNIPREKALEAVAGYACGHDVSARDWQKHKPGGQWLLGKGFDSFAPLGPQMVTGDEVGDPGKLDIKLRLNGETMQDSNTRQLIFSVDYLVSYLSQVCTLLPGDLIYTGTPPGVGAARKPPVFLKPGDVVEVDIEKLGILRNSVAAAS